MQPEAASGDHPQREFPFPNLKSRITSAASITGLGAILSLGAGTLANVAMARNGGPRGYAVFVAANMLVFSAEYLCSCGLPLALAKHVASEEERGRHEELRRASTTTLGLAMMVALLVSAAVVIFLPGIESYLSISFGRGFALAFPVILIFAVLSDCIQGIYYGLLRSRTIIAITITGPLVMFLYILLYRMGAPIPIWGAVATTYITSGLVAGYAGLRDRLFSLPAKIKEIVPILRDVVPAATFTFFTIFSAWSDRWVVATVMGAVMMASYSAAVIVIQAALRIPTHVAYLLVPASTRVALGGVEKSKRFNQAVIGAFASFAALTALPVLLAPSLIVHTLFGPGFYLTTPILLIMAPAILVSAINIPFISALTGSERNRLVSYMLVITVGPRLLLLLFFTWYWSLLGTALATVVSDLFMALCSVLLAQKIGMPFPLRALVRPYLAAFIAYLVGLGSLLLGAPTLLAVSLALALYLGWLFFSYRRFKRL